ncbi:MAG: outer membrane lipid asymmetry maintenance protein MlaD [Gammaproteobacteria bacterium]|nr:outer membrane lipid asymmetry maintenance protein MlaD [Gammaproteobacteria bacterium]
MTRFNTETVVGLFLLAGIAAFAWLTIALGDVDVLDDRSYTVKARFTSVSGLKEGSPVEIAGVPVGKVQAIDFDPGRYEAVVSLRIPNHIELQDDAIASVRSTGIIGSKFVKITPGGSPDILAPGDEIVETEASVSLEELISKYIFETK